jgi:hypothetical protein
VERKWVNTAGLVGLFEIEWKTPHHNILVEFLNNWKLEQNHRRRIKLSNHKVMMAKEHTIINKHLLVEVF